MHEMSLVQTLFLQLEELARENNCQKILTVTVEIGPLSGVVIDSFQFGFDVLAAERDLTSKARLQIEIPTLCYTCSSCGKTGERTEERPRQCPFCKETLLIPVGGDDLLLLQVEME